MRLLYIRDLYKGSIPCKYCPASVVRIPITLDGMNQRYELYFAVCSTALLVVTELRIASFGHRHRYLPSMAEYTQYYYRQRGRAAQYRDLVQSAGEASAGRRATSRKASEARAQKHHQLLQALALEDALERQRCQPCDMVRAEAFGMGHRNWMQRQCSSCFALSAERSARARHLGQPLALEELSAIRDDALFFRIAAVEERLGLMTASRDGVAYSVARTAAEAHQPHRSARLLLPGPAPEEAEEAEIAPAASDDDGSLKHDTQSRQKDQAADPGSGSDDERRQASCAAGGAPCGSRDPGKEKPQPRHDGGEAASDSDASEPYPQPSGGRSNLPAQGTGDAQPSSQSKLPTRSTGDVADSVRQLIASLRSGDRRAVLDSLLASSEVEGLLADVLSQAETDTASVLAAAGLVAQADESAPPPTIQPPPMTAFERIREELKQAEQDVVFGSTQVERSRALHLAFDLRRGLAELHGLQRREQRGRHMEQYKERVVVPRPRRAGSATTEARPAASPDEYYDPRCDIKHVVGGRPSGPVSTGLVLAARSKARRTARALEGVQAAEREGHVGPKARLKFGISATPAAAVNAEAQAAEASGRRSQASPALLPGTMPALAVTGATQGLHKRGDAQAARLRGAAPTHPSGLDPLQAVDVVNWRPATSRTSLQHLPGSGVAGGAATVGGAT